MTDDDSSSVGTGDRETARTVVRATVACILAVSVVSGPLVGAIDLTPSPDADFLTCEGGSASVDVPDPPGDLTLDRGAFGADTYTVSGSEARVHVESVSGCPRLLYRLEVPALDLDARQVRFLEGTQPGDLTLSPPAARIAPDRVDRGSYEGTVTIVLQGDRRRVLSRTNVTVEVVE